MNELGDIKGMTLVAVMGVLGGFSAFLKLTTIQFASAASEYISQELLPWASLFGIIITATMAILNRRDKMRSIKRQEIANQNIDSP